MKKKVALAVALCAVVLAGLTLPPAEPARALSGAVTQQGGQTYVRLDGRADEGVRLMFAEEYALASKTEGSETYAVDMFGHIQLAAFETPVPLADGLAVQMNALYNRSAFRLYLLDSQGEAFMVKNNAAYSYTYPDGETGSMLAEHECLWPYTGEGTLYLPYSAYTVAAPAILSIDGLARGNGKLDDIARIVFSFDMAETSANAAPLRKVAVSRLANVTVAEARIEMIADLSRYSYSNEPQAEDCDVNLADPSRSRIIKPVSTDAFKNGNWKIGKATEIELAERAGIVDKWTGDVKVLDNFDIANAERYDDDQLDAIMRTLLAQYGERAEVGAVRRGGGTALKWTIGDYHTEYEGVDGGNAGITLTRVSGAEAWTNWEGAKGFSLYIKNGQPYEVTFNLVVQLKVENYVASYRMTDRGGTVYTLSAADGRESALPVSDSKIVLRGGFEGYLRVPFRFYEKYSANAPQKMSFEYPVHAILLTSPMKDNSRASYVIDDMGVYYDEFCVRSSFFSWDKTIAGNMREEEAL